MFSSMTLHFLVLQILPHFSKVGNVSPGLMVASALHRSTWLSVVMVQVQHRTCDGGGFGGSQWTGGA